MSYDAIKVSITHWFFLIPYPIGMNVYGLSIKEHLAIHQLIKPEVSCVLVRHIIPDFNSTKVKTYMNLVMLAHGLCMQRKYISRDKNISNVY